MRRKTDRGGRFGDRRDPDRVLAAAYRAAVEPGARDVFVEGLPSRPASWSDLASRASREGMAGWLHKALAEPAVRTLVPGDVFAAMEREALVTAARNLEFHATLREVSRALFDAGIEALALKGIALLELGLYEDWRLRPLSDLDLLVPRDRFAAARRVLEAIGFSPLPRVDRTLMRGRVAVDLHGLAGADLTGVIHVPDACNPIRIPAAWFEEGARWAGAMPLRLPRLDRLLGHLAIHLAYEHGFSRWIWAVDLLEILRRHRRELDRDTLARDAREHGFAAILALVHDVLLERFGERPGLREVLGGFEGPRGLASGLARSCYLRGARPRAARYAFALTWRGSTRYRATLLARALIPRGRARGFTP